MLSGPITWLAIASGGAIGALARYGVSHIALRLMGPNFPWGTLTVNAVGSVAMGAIVAWLVASDLQETALKSFLTIGILGAFTTFSTFALDAVTLYKDRSLMVAASYIFVSLIFSIGGVLLGLFVGRTLA